MPPAPVTPLEPWQTAWPALPALLMMLAGAWGLRREIRPDRWLWAILAVALAVRVLWMPVWLHEYDGHEAEYLDLLMGRRDLTRGGPLLYPAVQWLYWGLGRFAAHQAVPLILSAGLSLLAIGAAAGFVGRLTKPRVGLTAAGALAIWGSYAFWATSAYNVILPHALGAVSLWGLAVWIQGGRAAPAALLAGGAAALAVATRVEAWLLAPLGLALLIAYRPRGLLKGVSIVALGLGVGAVATGLLLWPGQTPGAEQRALSWGINKALLIYWDPFHVPGIWLVPLIGFALGIRRWPKLYVPLALFVVGTHAAFATFEDYGFRHLINGAVGVAAALGALSLARWSWALLGVAGAALLLHTYDVADRYYADEDHFSERAGQVLPSWDVSELGDCALICEDGRVLPEDQQRSHFNLWDPAEAEALRAERGCIRWLYGLQDHRWSSRAVRDRALRVKHLYSLTPLARVEGEQGFLGILYEVGERER